MKLTSLPPTKIVHTTNLHTLSIYVPVMAESGTVCTVSSLTVNLYEQF